MVISGSWLVKSLSKIASFLRMSEFVVGFIIMAFSTSIPELFVGITSALAGNSALALGTVIGANIANLTVVAGVAIVLSRGIKIKSSKTKKDALYMFFIALLPIALMLIGNSLSRMDGIILILVFFFYTYSLIKQRKGFKKELASKIGRWGILLSFVTFAFALVVLFLSARFVVKYATIISAELFLPPILIGLFLIALGTTLPELIFNIQAVLKKHPDMVLGDTIGSVVINSTLVLGITALIFPITSDFLLFFSSAIFMVIVCFLFATFVESGSKLYWKEGIAMVLLYSFFIIIEFYIQTLGG
jgi:cation:H+ antiporter